MSFSSALIRRRTDVLLVLLVSRFKKYFEFFSPCSYQFAFDLIILPWVMKSYNASYLPLASSSFAMFSSDGSMLKFSSHSFNISSDRRSCALRFLAITLLYLIVVCLILYLIGPLHDPVTWYGINYTGTQITQWDF